jgi:PPOX class probable FMN-dependent enzyme
MMRTIKDTAELDALYDAPSGASLTKVAGTLTPLYADWIGAARFCILSTVGAEGTDASPRGDDGPVVRVVDPRTLWLPDWRGNNRLDSLRNIVRDGRVSLMFMVPGSANVVRVNGRAVLTDDPIATKSFERSGKTPKVVVVVTVGEVYFQCAKAIMRSDLWSGEDLSGTVPTAGQLLREMDEAFDGETYDREYPETAKTRMW